MVKIGSRYTRAHSVTRTPTSFEEVNSMLDSDTETHIQNALLRKARQPRRPGVGLYVFMMIVLIVGWTLL